MVLCGPEEEDIQAVIHTQGLLIDTFTVGFALHMRFDEKKKIREYYNSWTDENHFVHCESTLESYITASLILNFTMCKIHVPQSSEQRY